MKENRKRHLRLVTKVKMKVEVESDDATDSLVGRRVGCIHFIASSL